MSNNESQISINEHLSALLDDEAGAFENRRVLDELSSDDTLSRKLSTYALIGETMRTGEAEKPVISVGNSFLDSIHEKIVDEDSFNQVVVASELESKSSLATNNPANDSSWLRPIGGFALAASVGALAFMGLQNMGFLGQQSIQPDGIANSLAPTAIVQDEPVKPATEELATTALASTTTSNNDEYMDANAQTRSMLKRYVDSHMQYANTSTFVPSVRVIAYTDHQ